MKGKGKERLEEEGINDRRKGWWSEGKDEWESRYGEFSSRGNGGRDVMK